MPQPPITKTSLITINNKNQLYYYLCKIYCIVEISQWSMSWYYDVKAAILFNHHRISFDVEGQHLLENYPFGNVYLYFCCKNTPSVFMLLYASAFYSEKWMQHDNIIIITSWISNIAKMIPEGPLNKMVPLTEDHGGGGGGGARGPPLAHGLIRYQG